MKTIIIILFIVLVSCPAVAVTTATDGCEDDAPWLYEHDAKCGIAAGIEFDGRHYSCCHVFPGDKRLSEDIVCTDFPAAFGLKYMKRLRYEVKNILVKKDEDYLDLYNEVAFIPEAEEMSLTTYEKEWYFCNGFFCGAFIAVLVALIVLRIMKRRG